MTLGLTIIEAASTAAMFAAMGSKKRWVSGGVAAVAALIPGLAQIFFDEEGPPIPTIEEIEAAVSRVVADRAVLERVRDAWETIDAEAEFLTDYFKRHWLSGSYDESDEERDEFLERISEKLRNGAIRGAIKKLQHDDTVAAGAGVFFFGATTMLNMHYIEMLSRLPYKVQTNSLAAFVNSLERHIRHGQRALETLDRAVERRIRQVGGVKVGRRSRRRGRYSREVTTTWSYKDSGQVVYKEQFKQRGMGFRLSPKLESKRGAVERHRASHIQNLRQAELGRLYPEGRWRTVELLNSWRASLARWRAFSLGLLPSQGFRLRAPDGKYLGLAERSKSANSVQAQLGSEGAVFYKVVSEATEEHFLYVEGKVQVGRRRGPYETRQFNGVLAFSGSWSLPQVSYHAVESHEWLLRNAYDFRLLPRNARWRMDVNQASGGKPDTLKLFEFYADRALTVPHGRPLMMKGEQPTVWEIEKVDSIPGQRPSSGGLQTLTEEEQGLLLEAASGEDDTRVDESADNHEAPPKSGVSAVDGEPAARAG